MGKKIYKNKFKQDVVFPETQIDIYTESVIGSKHKTKGNTLMQTNKTGEGMRR